MAKHTKTTKFSNISKKKIQKSMPHLAESVLNVRGKLRHFGKFGKNLRGMLEIWKLGFGFGRGDCRPSVGRSCMGTDTTFPFPTTVCHGGGGGAEHIYIYIYIDIYIYI